MTRNVVPPTRQGEIMDVAARLFTEHGFARTSMEDIADAVGIKKPSLYHYVESKAQIVGWIHEECVRVVHPSLKRYFEEELPPSEILFLVARDILGLLVDKPGYLRVYFENHRDLEEAEQKRIAAMRDEYFSTVKLTLARGQDAGILQVEDLDITVLAYFGMINWAYQWYDSSGPVTTEDLASKMWHIFMRGISSRGAKLTTPASYSGAVSTAV